MEVWSWEIWRYGDTEVWIFGDMEIYASICRFNSCITHTPSPPTLSHLQMFQESVLGVHYLQEVSAGLLVGLCDDRLQS